MGHQRGTKKEAAERTAAIAAEAALRAAADANLQSQIDDFAETETGQFATRVAVLERRTDALDNIVAAEHADSWARIQALVRSGNGPAAFHIGQQFTEDWTDKTGGGNTKYAGVPHNVCHFVDNAVFSDDGGETTETGNGMYMQWHYATAYDMPFDAKEAIYAAPAGGLLAGTYYFKVVGLYSSWDSRPGNEGKTFMFTLTDDLPEGAQLMLSASDSTADFTTTNISVVDSPYAPMRNHNYGNDGYMPLSLWDGESGSPLSGDASNYKTDGTSSMINHIRRALRGYARYAQSAIRQWLNSAAPARVHEDAENYPGWWTPQNKYDRIPSHAVTYTNIYADPVTTNTGKPGFLSGYSEDLIAAMRTVQVKSIYYTGTTFGTAASDITYDKVFLPSLTEMYITPQNATHDGGVAWDFYKNLNAASGRTAKYATGGTYTELISKPINNKTGSAVYVRLRSASSSGYGTWHVNTSGSVGGANATTATRQRPACCIG